MKPTRCRQLFALLAILGFSLFSSGCYVTGHGHDDHHDQDDHDHHDDDHH